MNEVPFQNKSKLSSCVSIVTEVDQSIHTEFIVIVLLELSTFFTVNVSPTVTQLERVSTIFHVVQFTQYIFHTVIAQVALIAEYHRGGEKLKSPSVTAALN